MKFELIAAAAAFAGVANGQAACINTALAIPACGTTALLSLGSSYGCGLTDFACQCSHSSAIQAAASSPVIAACGISTALSVQMAAENLCSCVAANGGGGSGGSAAGGSSAAATTAAGGASGGASSAAGAMTSAAMQTSAAAAGGSSAAGGAAGGSSNVYTGAAMTAGSFVPVGGVLGLLAGIVAYL